MKDMSLEELLDEAIIEPLLADHKAEILRRFEELEKGFTDIGVERDNALVAYESLKCCGNCAQHYKDCHNELSYEYCEKYKTDGLTREEREK